MLDDLLKLLADDGERHPPRRLTLQEYVASLAGLPLPSRRQKEDFAEFVAHAHSWYKHLPWNPPGTPFYFFLDRYAGFDRLVSRDGSRVFAERAQRGFHYSDIPTQDYRREFGFLAYSCEAGTTVVVAGNEEAVVPRDKGPEVGVSGQVCALPVEILEAGETYLTGVIHTLSAAQPWIGEDLHQWPEESGGQAMADKIRARCQVMSESGNELHGLSAELIEAARSPRTSMHMHFADPVLYELMTPERDRQYALMLAAMDRVCDLIVSIREAGKSSRPG